MTYIRHNGKYYKEVVLDHLDKKELLKVIESLHFKDEIYDPPFVPGDNTGFIEELQGEPKRPGPDSGYNG